MTYNVSSGTLSLYTTTHANLATLVSFEVVWIQTLSVMSSDY